MNDFMYLSAVISGFLCFIFGVFSFAAMSERENDFAKKLIIASVVFCLVCVFSMSKYTNYEKIYGDECLNNGYVEAYSKGDSWYCLSFGDEPRIMYVGSEN